MKRWAWKMQQGMRRLGWVGSLGLLMLVFSLLLNRIWVHAEQSKLASDEMRLASLQNVAHKSANSAPPRALPVLALPVQSEVPHLIKALADLAKKHGIELSEGHFEQHAVPESNLFQLQAIFPVRATYPAMHSFLADSLASLPNMVLDGFEFKRTDVSVTEMDTQLRLSFYLQAGK